MTGGANYTGNCLPPGTDRRRGAAAIRTDSRFARKAAPGDAGGFVV
jgi:hypothetical protein